jgi:hypothetical protein
VPLLLEPVVLELVVGPELLDDVVPPSGCGWHGPQVPCVLPTAMMHVSPGQQSALTVQAPHVGTQALW